MRPSFAAKKRDANEGAIVAALQAVGATVERLSGPDIPDLLVGYSGANYLLEVKTAKGALSDGQEEWSNGWQGNGPEVVRSPDEALAAIGCGARRTG